MYRIAILGYKLRIFCGPPISAKSIFGLKLDLLFIDRFGNTLIYALILIQKNKFLSDDDVLSN